MSIKRISISAGHYPQKRGAYHDGLIEHELAVQWIDKLLDIYDSMFDFDVNQPLFDLIPVPTGTLREKVQFINAHNFDYALELHFNSAHSKASGCETLFMPNSKRGFALASFIQDAMVEALQIRDRGVKEGMYWSSRERTNTPLYFLRRTNCPAAIIEPEFLQSYRETITEDKIINFCFAILQALETICIEEI